MHVVNCHQNTEAADLLGGLRPLRGRDLLVQELRERAREFMKQCPKAADGSTDGTPGDASSGVGPDLDTVDVSGVIAAVQVRHGY